ncbi:glycosyltransferase family 2 protein [Actinoplanes palleronii]|uniref:Glycosyl transferase n=1 Tax=Actinoplanes palleronii TaxID=113570 RepID=A0ABQ4BNV5_9ACTN|nr:glycosyltransferase family 2 protein [Actinoplanes palleronii]GIE72345.1 glycosyl transferase [Actinoplanes palleronii]
MSTGTSTVATNPIDNVRRGADCAVTALIPCYNEEACIERAYREIAAELEHFTECEILFVDDGSTDTTLEKIKAFAAGDERVKFISFARNFGLEAAFSAGFKYARTKWTVQLDADLQSPPAEIHTLLDKALEGYDIVFGIRLNRRDPWLRRMGSIGHQLVAQKLLGIKLPLRASVFRLVRTSVARRIVETNLRSPYFIATAPLVGARYIAVPTKHQARVAGVAKWNAARLISHAMDLWIGFSIRPLALVHLTAVVAAIASTVLLALLALGWIGPTAIAVATLVLGSAAFLGLGVLSRYMIPALRVRSELPRFYIRETNIPIDQADDLYGSEQPWVGTAQGRPMS